MNDFSNHWKRGRAEVPIIGKTGFTLIELLVVFAIVALMAALLVPAVARALGSGQRARCASNLRELAQANGLYAGDSGSYVPAAEDIWSRNTKRWHGLRTRKTEPFDAAQGPLYPYLGADKSVRTCGSFKPGKSGFEAGCGGYGYNVRGVGSRSYFDGSERGAAQGMKPEAIAAPSETVMFTDAAFLEGMQGRVVLIEYSFAEAPQFLSSGPVPSAVGQAQPSIHFRHAGRVSVVWCDGHVSTEPMAFSYGSVNTASQLGWFGPADNSLFDPY